jgi:acyl-CoA dehydrogenase
MDFEDTPEEAAFRAEVRAFLEANATRRSGAALGYETEDDATHVPAARRWQATKAQAGFAGITWPKSAGGRGGKPIEEVIFRQEEKNYAVPRGVFEIAMNVCIPAILDHGTPEQHASHVAAALRGEEIWCQLFSEPGAGSDLAGLRTQARREGDEWVIDGQKTWTSSGHYADFGLLIARTDPTVPKHEGLTTFILDMRTPGVEVVPIKQMSGKVHSGFNNVFFGRIPYKNYVTSSVSRALILEEIGHYWRNFHSVFRKACQTFHSLNPHCATANDAHHPQRQKTHVNTW